MIISVRCIRKVFEIDRSARKISEHDRSVRSVLAVMCGASGLWSMVVEPQVERRVLQIGREVRKCRREP